MGSYDADSGVRRLRARELESTDTIARHAAAAADPELAGVLRFATERRLTRGRRGAFQARPAARAALRSRDGEPASGSAAAPALLQRTEVTDRLMRLEVSRPAGFSYRAGQHVKLGLPGLLRTYSLVSAPHEAHLEFFVELMEGGRLSPRLRTLEPGAVLTLGRRAKGKLAVDTGRPNQLMVATVTGIAPYVSLLRDHFHGDAGGGRRFVVLHGASYADEFGYAAELAGLARRFPASLTYVPTVSRPGETRNARWSGARGRVEEHLDELVRRLGLTPQNTAAFACGNPAMVRNVSGVFHRGGFPTYTEPFD